MIHIMKVLLREKVPAGPPQCSVWDGWCLVENTGLICGVCVEDNGTEEKTVLNTAVFQ